MNKIIMIREFKNFDKEAKKSKKDECKIRL
jgi:hypothetical protein